MTENLTLSKPFFSFSQNNDMINFADTTSIPLYSTRRELAPYGLFYGYPESPPVPNNSHESIQTSSVDDKIMEVTEETVTVKKVSFTKPPQPSPLAPTLLKSYCHPQKNQPIPFFIIGRYRFPGPARRLLPSSYSQPQHAPQHPGTFPSPQFEDDIWTSTPLDINDTHIKFISPEDTFFGIDYVIDVHDSAWAKKTISRGTSIIFRNYSSHVTRYLATWQLDTIGKHAYVQFSAFRVNQATHYQDPDWPTLRIKVPASLCKVPVSPHAQNTEKIVTPSCSANPTWYEYLCCCPCFATPPFNYDDYPAF